VGRERRISAAMPVGDAIVALGRTFLGATYTPGTLEVEGPERLVVNLRELDCVTYVETVLAMVRILRAGTPDFESYKRELVRIRYRDGVLAGYPSRLHYFSEWISNNESKGIVQDVTAQLGGERRPGRTFMTEHRDAYRQLARTEVAAEIGRIEATLSGRTRYYIPQASIAQSSAASGTATSSRPRARWKAWTWRTRASRCGSAAACTSCTRRWWGVWWRSASGRWPSGSSASGAGRHHGGPSARALSPGSARAAASPAGHVRLAPSGPDVEARGPSAARTDDPDAPPHVGHLRRPLYRLPGQFGAADRAGQGASLPERPLERPALVRVVGRSLIHRRRPAALACASASRCARRSRTPRASARRGWIAGPRQARPGARCRRPPGRVQPPAAVPRQLVRGRGTGRRRP
jgi:hypothetical protein